MKKFTLFILPILILSYKMSFSQELGRRASFEAKISSPDGKVPGAHILAINPATPLAKAGLAAGDRIIKVNDRPIHQPEDWTAVIYALRADEETKILAKRGNRLLDVNVRLNPLAKEQHEELETLYESVTSDYGITQRCIITRPRKSGKLPAIFLIQGLSCSSIEKYTGRSSNWSRVITDIVEKSNMVVIRVEKPGVGDSDGDCGKTDFKTELSGYEAAIELLKSKPYVDTTRIIVYGSSMGSALAPYFTNKYHLAGCIAEGTFYKTWYEHMLEIERRILEMEGTTAAEIYDKMNKVYIPLYHGMLIEKKSFEEILKENPLYRKYHRQGLQHMYGRPMKYYHQVQDFNFAGEWEKIQVPVRIMWGTNDWIMSEEDNDMIISVLKSAGHSDHLLFKYPGLDHWSTIHPDAKSSYTGQAGQWEDKISQQIIDWAWEIIRK